jgi:hypothetical protein
MHGRGFDHLHLVVTEVRQLQVSQEQSPIGMGICAHPSFSLRRKFGQLRLEPPSVVKKLLGLVALHPFFEKLHVIGLGGKLGQGHLVRPPGIFDGLAVHDLRAGPAFGSAENNHGPRRPIRVSLETRFLLDRADLCGYGVERRRHQRMHNLRIMTFHKVGLISISRKKVREFDVRHSAQNCRIGNLVAVQVQDGKDRAVTHGV